MSRSIRFSSSSILLGTQLSSCFLLRQSMATRNAIPMFVKRNFSASSSSSSSFHPSVAPTLSQLNSFRIPRFELPQDSVEVITSPSDFYSKLKEKILSANSRVFLASLYIGKTETELIETIKQALRKNPDLHVYILSDALRGTRESPYGTCSASLLAPLITEFGNRRLQICMYHTPALHGLKKLLIPNRFNEGWGLQHMKLYGFDDEIILSGANLSNDYFTNRQDRYMLFKSAPLTEYYFKIFQAVSSISYKVVPIKQDGNKKPSVFTKLRNSVLKAKPKPTFFLQWDPSFLIPEPTKDPRGFIQVASTIVKPLLRTTSTENYPVLEHENNKEVMTYVFPISQLSPLFSKEFDEDPSTELPVINSVLSMLTLDSFNWVFTAGYFNMLPEYKSKLLQSSPPYASVITASPKANGFYLSKGVSGMLPDAYSLLASKFLQEVIATDPERNRTSKIRLVEWERGQVNTPGGWSYHAKGIWIFEPSGPVISPKDYSRKPTPVKEENEQSTNTEESTTTTIKKEEEKIELKKEIINEEAALASIAKPLITVIGSSNYTRRAYSHDLETNAVVITRDPELQTQISDEVKNLLKYTKEMTPKDYEERKISFAVKFWSWVLGDKL